MSLLDLSQIATEVSDDQRPWPHDGQEFELFAAVFSEDDSPVLIEMAPEVYTVIHEMGSASSMTTDLFSIDDIPTELGLWKLKLKFFQESSTDWEYGTEECEVGFSVIAREKL